VGKLIGRGEWTLADKNTPPKEGEILNKKFRGLLARGKEDELLSSVDDGGEGPKSATEQFIGETKCKEKGRREVTLGEHKKCLEKT